MCTEQIEHRGVIFPAGTIVAICAERANRDGEDGAAGVLAIADALAAGVP